MKQSIRNREGDVFYEAEFDMTNQLIYTRLSGNLTIEDIRSATEAFVELFKISGVNKLINDITEVKGAFSGIEHWTVDDKIKELNELGLKAYAQIANSDYRKINKITLSLKSQNIDYKVFKNAKKAKKWLAGQ